MRKLIFDIEITGHHSEYIGHLSTYLSEAKTNDTYIFVVHTKFKEKFYEIVNKSKHCKNIDWVFVERYESEMSYNGNLVQKSFNQPETSHEQHNERN